MRQALSLVKYAELTYNTRELRVKLTGVLRVARDGKM